jgi:hypothetical protein
MILAGWKGDVGTLLDARGVELPSCCIWADTETGESVHLFLEDGRVVKTVDDMGRPTVRMEWLEHPAPLKWIPA